MPTIHPSLSVCLSTKPVGNHTHACDASVHPLCALRVHVVRGLMLFLVPSAMKHMPVRE